uniref:Uncharacterized protein n=1 Tax=Arundo donax TaxID=35708 RepID=A0A0A9DJK4_ARUDO
MWNPRKKLTIKWRRCTLMKMINNIRLNLSLSKQIIIWKKKMDPFLHS